MLTQKSGRSCGHSGAATPPQLPRNSAGAADKGANYPSSPAGGTSPRRHSCTPMNRRQNSTHLAWFLRIGVLESSSMLGTGNTTFISIWPLTELRLRQKKDITLLRNCLIVAVAVIRAMKEKGRMLWKQAYASLGSGKDSFS